MINLNLPELTQDLTVLGVAEESLSRAEEQLERARLPYQHAIQVLEDAMNQDGNVLAAVENLDEYKDLHKQAEEKVQGTALSAWMNEQTEGAKEWSQGEWEIRLRTTKTPIVTSIFSLVTDLVDISAVEAVIKRLTLNKADTVKLHESITQGLEGLEIEEKTTCSVRRGKE